MTSGFAQTGWARFPVDPAVLAWVSAALPAARRTARDPAMQQKWLQCQGTWFVGVDALANDAAGAVAGSGPLAGVAWQAACAVAGALPLHPAQLSVTYPGYPKPRRDESDAAFRYRQTRDAAHVDGLLAEGPARRRMIREPHAYILGLPLTDCSPDASPLVVWEGSHEVMRRAFRAALAPYPRADWGDVDVTEAYHAARRVVFDSCQRVELPAHPGEATLIHRLALHGVAPWADGATAPPEGRMIAYFRPQLPGGVADWLALP